MKLISAVVIAASVGTCSLGGQQKLPPSPAEQEAASQSKPKDTTSDPWAGIPAECGELATACEACDEVERIRRKIEFEKCVPVCKAYLDRIDVLSEIPQDAVNLLQGPDACGKTETACSPVEQSRCEYVIGYATAGALFRAHWAEHPEEPGGLSTRFHDEFLTPYLDHHGRVSRWAASNDVPAAAMMSVGGELMSVTSTEMIKQVMATLATAEDPALSQLSALVELVRYPGEPASFDDRRTAADAAVPR